MRTPEILQLIGLMTIFASMVVHYKQHNVVDSQNAPLSRRDER
jgi:hypothetical protein